ncbi:MAG: aspartate kinase [Bacteroidota bacterium]|nr:aspartate kinase [Bacteroidota bacterium]
MRVFKFGGASVKDANAVKNVAKILNNYKNEKIVVVLSAMGKTTNALEQVVNAFWQGEDFISLLSEIENHHLGIVTELFDNSENKVADEIRDKIFELKLFLQKPLVRNYDYIYDQVISTGEILSTKIVAQYLIHLNMKYKWVDARNFVITDEMYRQARVEWETTKTLIGEYIPVLLSTHSVIVQGFIGHTISNHTTTLGREGSDYTAAIFAYSLEAEEVIIWKDVPGIMNADPRKYSAAELLPNLSYQTAVEMTYYGATVLHPKTIKPLQNKNIMLNVRSFVHPDQVGSYVTNTPDQLEHIPLIIHKENQVMLQIQTTDFSFIAENHIAEIFGWVVSYGINVNLMANTAISFSVCVDDRGQSVVDFIAKLSETFNIEVIKGLQILTIKNKDMVNVNELVQGKQKIAEVGNGNTIQYVLL